MSQARASGTVTEILLPSTGAAAQTFPPRSVILSVPLADESSERVITASAVWRSGVVTNISEIYTFSLKSSHTGR